MKTHISNDSSELKRANIRILVLSVIFATIASYFFTRNFFSELKPNDSMAGLAFFMLMPFVFMSFVFVSNTLLYFSFLIYTKISNPALAERFTIINSVLFFGVLILLFVTLYFSAGLVLIILSTLPILALIVLSMFYYKITVFLSTFSTSKVVKFSAVVVTVLISFAIVSTSFFQYKIKQLKSESNSGMQLSQEIIPTDCRVYSLFEHQGSILSDERSSHMEMYKFGEINLSYSEIMLPGEYLGSLKLPDTEENIKKTIKEKLLSSNSLRVKTRYVIKSGPYTTIYINIYDSMTDSFSDYVIISSPSQRCSLF